jgi:hypothetical protein
MRSCGFACWRLSPAIPTAMTATCCAAIPSSKWRCTGLRTGPVFAADCLPRREHAAAPGALSHGPGDARPVLRQFPDRHLTLDLDESFDRGEQELRKFNAYYDDWGFLPIHIFDTSGRLVVSVLREAATPSGREILALVKRVVGHIRERFPRARIRLRGDSHYACPEVMRWCEANGLEYIFGLAGTAPLAAQVQTLEARTAARYAARPSHPSSSSAATRTSRAGPSRGNASAGSGRSRTRRGRHPLHRHQSDRPPGAAALRAEILPERENLLKSLTWPPIGPPARELAPTRSGSFCMAPPIGCSGRSRASCRSARPGASSTPSGTG